MGLLSGISLETKLIVAAAVVAYIFGKRWYDQRGSDVRRVKKPANGDLVWGHEKEAWETPDAGFYTKNFNSLGQVFAMKGALLHPDILAVSDPAALAYMFTKRPYDFVKSPVIRPLIERLIGRSLPWAEGDLHKAQRQMLSPVFTHESVKRMDEEVHVAAETLVDVLRNHIHTNSPAGTEESDPRGVLVNILDWSCRVTLDIIGKVGFGHDFQCGQSPEADAIRTSWRQLTEMGLQTPGFVAPLVIRAFPFITQLPVEPIQAQGEIKVIIKKLAMEITESRKALQSDAAVKGGKDLLSSLLRLNERLEAEDIDQLLDHIVTFVMVGHETVSTTISFALMELARRKDLQDKLRQEINDFTGSGPGGEPTYEEYQNKLPFLDAVVKETLRIYPAASQTERIAEQDDILPLRFPIQSQSGEELTSIRIKKGQVITVPTIAVNRGEAIWGPDAEVFRPERWIIEGQLPPASSLTQGFSGLFSFIEGPRICIGYRLALYEFKVILCSLLQNFEFTTTGDKIITQFSSTLQPYIQSRKSDGIQIPLYVKEIHD